MSQRTRRSRRRTNKPNVYGVLLKAGLTLGAIVAFVALAIVVNRGVPGRDYSKLYLNTPQIGSLKVRDRVAIGGVRVGQVMAVASANNRSLVELQLDPGVNLPRNTKVRLRANGLLGARYVQLIPGSDGGRRLADGATLTLDEKALTTSVPDALDVLNEETRGGLKTALDNLGEGMLGRGAGLNNGIAKASGATVPFTQIMNAILARPGAAEALAPSIDAAMRAALPVREEIAAMLDPGARGLRPFADRRERLRETLDLAPSTLDAANSGLTRGAALLASARRLSESAQRTLPDAPPGLREATKLLRRARTDDGGGSPLERTTRLLRVAQPTVPAALRITKALDPVLPRVQGAIEPLRPMVRYIGRYDCDIINAGITVRSMTGYVGTGEGPSGPAGQFRLQAVAGTEALGIREAAQYREAYPAPCGRNIGRPFSPTPGTNLGSLLGTP